MELVSSIGRRGSSTGMSLSSTYVVTANRAGNDELEDAAVREETDVLDLGSSSSSHAVGPTLNAAPSEAFRAGSLAVHPGKAAEAEKEKIAAQQAERLKEANALNSEPHGHGQSHGQLLC